MSIISLPIVEDRSQPIKPHWFILRLTRFGGWSLTTGKTPSKHKIKSAGGIKSLCTQALHFTVLKTKVSQVGEFNVSAPHRLAHNLACGKRLFTAALATSASSCGFTPDTPQAPMILPWAGSMIGTPPSIKTRPEVSNAARSPPLDFSPFTAASKSFVSLAESCSQGWWNQACTIHTHSKHEKTGNGMSKEKCDTKKTQDFTLQTSLPRKEDSRASLFSGNLGANWHAPILEGSNLRLQKAITFATFPRGKPSSNLQFLPKGHALQGNQVATSITNRNGDLPAFEVASKATKIYKIALNH